MITDINMYSLRHNNISFMEQQLILLEGIAEENILLSERYSLDNINNLLEDDNYIVQDYLKSLGKVNSEGSGVSGGEGQKLGLFRMFAKNSEVYILDEPTASLDKKSINAFMKYIHKIKQEKIVIIISHDATIINRCDYIINL